MQKLNVRFNNGTKSKLKALSDKTGLKESVLARAALNRGLDRLSTMAIIEGRDACLDVVSTYENIFDA